MNNNQEWALVTGASSGIGKAFTELFALNGINVVLAARDKQALTLLASHLEKNYGIKTLLFAGDLSTETELQKLTASIDRAKLRVTYLINSAGFGLYGPLLTTDWERERDMIKLNDIALTYLNKHFAHLMKQEGRGYIVNLASLAAFFPGPNMAVYYASKAYVLHLSEALAEELSGTGVFVTALCPGPTASGFAQTAKAADSSFFRGRLPLADDVARFGYKAMLSGKRVAIHGWRNKLTVFVIRFIPRRLAAHLVARIR